MKKERADKIILSRGLVSSAKQAQALIMAGLVFTEGQKVEKPGQMINPEKQISIYNRNPYVSRGGLKLEEALDIFAISVQGKIVADLGASTGGFTDCLLQKGANKIYAIDVETRQFDWQLSKNPRIILIKKNARYLKKEDFADNLDLITMDLSFISVLKIVPAIKEFLGTGLLISLLKPQFEVEKGLVGKKGIVRDISLHEDVLKNLIGEMQKIGFRLLGLIRSSIRGQKGNREFFAYWSLKKRPLGQKRLQILIKKAVWNEQN